MATNLQRISAVDPCIPPAVRKELQKVASNVEQNVTFEGDVYNNLLVEISSNPISYFTNSGTAALPGDTVVARHVPPLQIQITSNPSESAGIYTMNAKLIAWNGSSYAVSGSDFAVTDIFDKWHHAFSGHKGFLQYDTARGVLYPYDLNSPTARDVTLAAGSLPLAKDGTCEWTDTGDGQVSGSDALRKAVARYNITNWKIASGVRASIVWHPKAESGAGRWYITTIDKCAVQ